MSQPKKWSESIRLCICGVSHSYLQRSAHLPQADALVLVSDIVWPGESLRSEPANVFDSNHLDSLAWRQNVATGRGNYFSYKTASEIVRGGSRPQYGEARLCFALLRLELEALLDVEFADEMRDFGWFRVAIGSTADRGLNVGFDAMNNCSIDEILAVLFFGLGVLEEIWVAIERRRQLRSAPHRPKIWLLDYQSCQR
jgi:hypothetical protein